MIEKERVRNVLINENAINSLANALKNRDRLLVLILNCTACKTSEIIELKLKNISEKSIRINERDVSIPESLYLEVQNYAKDIGLSPEMYIFSSRQNQKITAKRIRQIIQNSAKNILGFSINPKDLRKYVICKRVKENDSELVKKQVGLKRFDKRRFLTESEIKILNNAIKDSRTKLLFSLLLNGYKSTKISKIKVNEFVNLNVNSSVKNKLKKYAARHHLSETDPLFLTRQKSSLTKERIFQIISSLSNKTGIKITPRVLNNTFLARMLLNSDTKTHSFHLYGGFYHD